MSRDYELGMILSPEVNEEETQSILNRIEQIVAPYDGQVVRVQQWGRRRLAYPIERNRDGYYVFIDMILSPETVSELERTLRVSETVLRHMFRRRNPKAVQQEREEREARAAQAAANAEAAAANAAANAEATAPSTEVVTANAEATPPSTEVVAADAAVNAETTAPSTEANATEEDQQAPTLEETVATPEAPETPEVPDEDYGEVPPALAGETV